MASSLRVAALISLPVLALLVGLVVWNPLGDFWKMVETPKAQCEAYDHERLHSLKSPTSEIYDQRKLDRLVREPQNTISNLAYATAGLAILLAGRRPASRSLGLAGIFLGFWSGMYHAALLPEWRLIDILGVYAVLYCVLLVGVSANWTAPNRQGGILVLLTWAAAIGTGIYRNDVRWLGFKIFDSTYVFVGAVTFGSALALLAVRKAVNRPAYFKTLALLMVAAAISFSGGIGDRFGGFWANPDFPIQGHAVWHMLGAVAMLVTYEAFAATGFDRSTLQPRIPA